MDPDIEKIHSILVDADLPSSINDLQNPEEKYIVKLLSAFLAQFHIDVNVIENLTLEQQQIMTYSDDSDIIGIINLYATIAHISEEIFLKELHITDITSPGPKRTRRQAKFLANFVLYTTNKTTDIQDSIDIIYSRGKIFEEILQKNNAILKSINETALHTTKQLSLEEKVDNEIEKLKIQIHNEKKNLAELDIAATDAEGEKQVAVQRCQSLKTEALKGNKLLAESQSNIVKSPEEYRTRLQKLEEQSKQKAEERVTMQEAFQAKKQLIDHKEKILKFIQKQHAKCPVIKDVVDQLMNANSKVQSTKSQVQTLKANISELETLTTTNQDQCGATRNDELNSQYMSQVSSLRALHSQLLRDKRLMETKLREERSRFNEALLMKNELHNAIKKYEEETTLLIKNYQKTYDDAIMKEEQIRKYFM